MSRVAGLLILIIINAIVVFVAAVEEKLYSDKYDYIDVTAILNNDRHRESYYKCFLGSGPCRSPDSVFFRDRFPEAIVTNCKKCTKKQSENFDKLTDWYTKHELEKYNAIVAVALKRLKKKNENH